MHDTYIMAGEGHTEIIQEDDLSSEGMRKET